MDKYWITFSQWHKSSAAAGFEAACGVVRHFKRSCVAPFEGMVNRGIQRALRQTGLREVTSFFSRLILPRSASMEPSRHKWDRLSASTSLSISPPSFSFATTFRLYLQPSPSLLQSTTVFLLLFQPSRGHLGFGSLLSSRTIAYHCRCSLL